MVKRFAVAAASILAAIGALAFGVSPVLAVDLHAAIPTIDAVYSRSLSPDTYYITWVPSGDAPLPDHFTIYTSGPNGFSATNQTNNGSAVSYAVPNLSPNTQYTFQVEAFYNGDGGAISAEHSDYTKALPPGIPVVGSIATSSIALTMAVDNNNPPSTKYLFYLSDGKDDLYLDAQGNQSLDIADAYVADAATWAQAHFAAIGLTPNYEYFFGAMSVNDPGTGYNGSERTPNIRTKVVPAKAVQAFGVVTSTIWLRWVAPKAGETKYIGEMSDDGGNSFISLGEIGGPRLWVYIVNNLLPNKKYIFRVAMADNDGHQSDFVLSDPTYTMPLAPEIPLVDAPRITAHTVPLTMVPAVGNPTTTRYNFLTRSMAGDGAYLGEKGVVGPPMWLTAEQWAQSDYFVTGLEPNTEYFFNAVAITDDGFQPSYSSYEVSATTLPEPKVETSPTPAPVSRGGGNPGPLIYTNRQPVTPSNTEAVAAPLPAPRVDDVRVLGEKISGNETIDELLGQVAYGQTSEAVKKLQTALRNARFFPHWVRSTGWYGPITRAAVAKYQASK